MKVLPITNSTNNLTVRGRISNKTAELTKYMSEGWLSTATSGKYKTLPIINTCLYTSERINNIHLNLLTIMERFGKACELTYEKSLKSGKYRFFISNKYSNYRTVCGDAEFSPALNKLRDVEELENIEKKVAKLNPYEENSHFIIQRKSNAKDIIFDKEFEPDADYVFLEDKLIKREVKEATMEDLEEFISEAKKDGIV